MYALKVVSVSCVLCHMPQPTRPDSVMSYQTSLELGRNFGYFGNRLLQVAFPVLLGVRDDHELGASGLFAGRFRLAQSLLTYISRD